MQKYSSWFTQTNLLKKYVLLEVQPCFFAQWGLYLAFVKALIFQKNNLNAETYETGGLHLPFVKALMVQKNWNPETYDAEIFLNIDKYIPYFQIIYIIIGD